MSIRRSGCRRAAPRPSHTLVGNWVHRGRTTAHRARTSTSSTRWCGSSIATAGRRQRLGGRARPPYWFERDYAPPEPFPAAWPGRWRSAEAYPTRRSIARWAFAGRDAAAGGRLAADEPRPCDVRGALPASPDDGHPRRALVGRRRRSPTAWPATCGPTRRPARPIPPRRSSSRSRSSASPRSCSTWQCRRPVATAVVRLSDVAPDGTRRW